MQPQRFVDLHMHSTYSDGVLTPEELVAMAVKKGLVAIALSDHDSVEGYRELAAAAEDAGVEVLSGVEMSCEYNGRDLHVLGYGVSVKSEGLLGMLRHFRTARETRGEQIVEKLAAQGVQIDMARVREKAGKGALGRPHIAETMVEAGLVADFAEAFGKYIGEGCPAYVDKYKMSPSDAVEHIHGAGGLAFVAHPGYYLEDRDAFDKLLDHGFDGIEVHHPHHKGNTVGQLLEIARSRGLLVSGGSDFHGFAGRDNMGEPPVPYELFEGIRSRLS
jgi:predicted metal-dependent phosphoesterase TrpH